MRTISVLINARLQSSRMESKMVRPFGGSNLLNIALEKLNRLDFFTHRFLAVAEEELKEIGAKYKNVELLERYPEAVEPGPHDPMITFEHYARVPTKFVFVINACHAFLSVATIKKAFDIFQKTSHRSYLSVVKTRDWIFTKEGKALTHTDPDALQNTSHGNYHYKASHAFYIIDRDYFVETKGKLWNLVPNDPYLIEMPAEEACDVDTDTEFEFSAYLYQKRFPAV